MLEFTTTNTTITGKQVIQKSSAENRTRVSKEK